MPARATTALASATLRIDRMKVSTWTGGMVCATPSASSITAGSVEAKVIVKFPSTFTLTVGNWSVNTTNLPAGSTAWPTIGGATITGDNTAKTVTFDTTATGDLTSGSARYCFNFAGTTSTSPVQTAASAANDLQGYIETQTAAAAQIDYSEIALATVTDDQILVTAVVPPTFQITITGGMTAAFTAPLTGPVTSTNAVNFSITTNAKGGWTAWAKDTDRSGGTAPNNVQGIYSTSANYTIPATGTVNGSPDTLSNGTDGYVMDVNANDQTNGCTAAPAAEYNGLTTSAGGTLSKDFQPIANCSGVDGSGHGTSAAENFDVIERAATSAVTPAATDYSDLITIVAAGNF